MLSALTCQSLKVAALAGGVGGAKLVTGLAYWLKPENLNVIVNTGDDFEFFGLKICPDLDSILYALAGLQDPVRGWGLNGDTDYVLQALKKIGAPDWFQLGDKDLATHLERTRLLSTGVCLTEVTRMLCARMNVATRLLPMSDDPAPTMIRTKDGRLLGFQEYFVKEHFMPEIAEIDLTAAARAKPTAPVLEAIDSADLVVLCPSNPWVSIDPILKMHGIRGLLQKKHVVAVSPIIQGKAVKGPAAKMFAELGIEPGSFAVLEHYGEILNGFVLDTLDAPISGNTSFNDIIILKTETLMKDSQDKIRLAGEVLDLGLSMLQ